MSVLKEKRTVSKAEYVNTANQIYVETVGFLTRLSPLTAANVWCRSVNSSNNNNFCLVNTDGSANNNNANNSWALAP